MNVFLLALIIMAAVFVIAVWGPSIAKFLGWLVTLIGIAWSISSWW